MSLFNSEIYLYITYYIGDEKEDKSRFIDICAEVGVFVAIIIHQNIIIHQCCKTVSLGRTLAKVS